MKTSYMHKERVKQMEDIGVKVALGAAGGKACELVVSWGG